MPSRQSHVAHAAAALLVLATTAAIFVPTATAATPVPAVPPQGLYEGCAPGTEIDVCINRLTAIRRAGFRYVLNYSAWYGSPDDVLRYADAAAALDLELIWPLNNPAWRGLVDLAATYPALASGLGSGAAPPTPPDDALLAARAIGVVAYHPATWGFYVGDELPASEAERVRALSATVRRVAPSVPLLYIARPGVRRLAPFARFADVVGSDPYPIGSGDPAVGSAARSAHAAASTAGARTAMVLQAFSWSQYRHAPAAAYPNARTLRAMRDAAIRHAHPTMILWYSYQDILRSDHPRRRWRALAQAAFAPP